MKAVWNGKAVAESDDIVVFEGINYFPLTAVDRTYASQGARIFHCPKRGYGAYYALRVDNEEKPDAGVFFPHPYPEASEIKGRICFLYGVEIIP